MARSGTCWPIILAALFVITKVQCGWAENPKTGQKTNSIGVPNKSKHKQQKTWHVYRLDGSENDPNFGQWVADTIVATIPKDNPGTVKYYAPGRILAVYHTPSVQAEVEAFLESLKDVLPQGKERLLSPIAKSPVPAKFPTSLVRATEQGNPISSGPASQQPRHLFHIMVEGLEQKGDRAKLKSFTLRYEGEGIIDSNLAWLIKSLNENSDKSQESGKPALNTADLTRYITDLLGGTCPVPVPACAPALLPLPESTSKASEARKGSDRKPSDESPAPISSAPVQKSEPAPVPKPSGDSPPPGGNSVPIP